MNRNNTFGTLFDGYIGASTRARATSTRARRGVRAGDQERALDRGHVQEHQVLEQHPQLRRLLHVGAGHVPAGPRRGRSGAREHRRREVLLRGRRPDPEPDQGAPQHGDPAGAHGPDRGRPLLGGGQQRRRALVQPRRHRVQLRDGRRPVRQHDAVGCRRGGRDRRPARRTGPASTCGDKITIDAGTANEEVRDRSPRSASRTRRARSRTCS